MAKSVYKKELKIMESEEAQSGHGHDDHGHGGGHGDAHGGGHGHDDHGHGGGHGADHGHSGGHGHDDHGGHGGGHGHDDHGHGGGHGGHDDHGHGGHAPAPKAAAAGSKMDDYIENVVFFPAGIMHNLVHILFGSVSGTISKTVIWDLHSGEADFKGGKIGKFIFGASPFLLLAVSIWLYDLSTSAYGAWQGVLFYLAFCAGFAAKPSGRDFKFMQEANTTLIAPLAIPVNVFTKFYKKVFFGLTGNMAIGVGTYLLAFYI